MNARKNRVQALVGIMLVPLHQLVRWIERAHQRRCLSELDNGLLADVGITPEDRRRECRKWFWQ
ncbi:DUF1127 domain-containing protein [Agrobacterium radiobacter]|uniref:DUF1127 domain-containing protein n=1 Tax=Agrobacterium radiobacter TaxID=362 RepID=UPI003F870136